jgi:hypothetical protein
VAVRNRIKTTGFPTNGYEHDDLVSLFKDVLKSKEKYLEF